ncbi:MAG TPA: dynamin family protein [Verrucomicrobiae bacterium]|nr:dynamin family protein [Verrucomicrobiae bacterium]
MSVARESGPISAPDAATESPLHRLAGLAEKLGSDRVREDAFALAQRTAEGRFYVACVGQFKRGKSTLLNALLGDRILPAGVLPLTTVPTVLRYGVSKRARVRFQGGAWTDISPADLSQFVSEELNPENRKQVVGVEVFSPSPLLAQGMCLVDTPGLGSVFSGNAAATQAFIPHIDAVIVVLGADPPMAGDELALVEEIGRQVPDLLVVLNKADRTSEEERSAAKSFTQTLLESRLKRPVSVVYEVSAEERLANHGPARDWSELVGALQGLVAVSGRALVQSSAERGFKRLREELLAIVSEERDALIRPIAESEVRIQKLRQTISDAERSLRDVSYLFTSEEHRLSDMFLAHRKDFLAGTMPEVNAEFETGIKALPRRYGPRFRRDALRLAQIVSERRVRPWLQAEQASAEAEYRKVASRFLNIGNDYLKKLSESGVRELSRMPHALDRERGFDIPSRFTFEELLHVALPASPLRYLADLFLGIAHAYVLIEKDAWRFLDHLMEMNSTRVQSDVVNRVQESRARLEVEIRKLLHEVARIAEHALDRARRAKAEGESAVQSALESLDGIERDLRALADPAATEGN